jgi:penicillin-binding protein 1A
MAYRLGVRSSPLDAVPSLTLGSIGVSPLEMASVYATLAAGGMYSKPMAIRKVVLANGKTDTDARWGKPQRERVISDGVAYAVTQVLEQNMLHGTGVGAYFGRISAGKTGTTDNYADAWFCGYVPQLEATVWVGYPKAEIPMLSVHGIAVSGPTFPAQIWRYFMETAVGPIPALDFPSPKSEPVWIPFHGQYQYGGSSGYSPSSSSSSSSGGGYTPPAATAQAPAPKVETVGGGGTPAPAPAPTPAPAPPPAPAPAPAPEPTVPAEPPPPPLDAGAPPSP